MPPCRLLLCGLLALCLCAPAWAQDAAPTRERSVIRVRLFEPHKPAALRVRSPGGLRIAGGGAAPMEAPPDAEVAVLPCGDRVCARYGGQTYGGARLRITGRGGAAVAVAAGPSGALLPYDGALLADLAAPGLLRLINEVDLEQYVAAVVSTEYGLDDVEGSKAMAVAARTYALKSVGKYQGAYDHVDHTASQVYKGAARTTALAREAAEATRGEVLRFQGALIQATYFSSSGGHTTANDAVWPGAKPVPYLQGVADPYDASPHRAWTSRIPQAKLLAALSQQYGGVTGVAVEARSRDGRVRSLRLTRAGKPPVTVASNEFRMLLMRRLGAAGLKSTFFDLGTEGGAYVFTGKGYGHGVGMSQWGAHGMAGKGFTYREILDHYYPGATLDEGARQTAAQAERDQIRKALLGQP